MSIESGTVIKNSKVQNSIIQKNAVLTGCNLKGSSIGNHAELSGAEGEVHVGDHSVLKQ